MCCNNKKVLWDKRQVYWQLWLFCLQTGKCKYNIVRNGDVKHLCDDVCFKTFRSSPTTYLRQAESKPPDNTSQVTKATPKQTSPASAATVSEKVAAAKANEKAHIPQVIGVLNFHLKFH